ncbi:hypothetical protein RRG08_020196 [Elysia crispata]|uniref:Uncharacterized protein n=1 Tax=Elysia crispata TaxID=231223 RepID=A0AAE1DQZ5_9GAST|nr:hypothetical protein RRG08_020196 [Elysia crispata]
MPPLPGYPPGLRWRVKTPCLQAALVVNQGGHDWLIKFHSTTAVRSVGSTCHTTVVLSSDHWAVLYRLNQQRRLERTKDEAVSSEDDVTRCVLHNNLTGQDTHVIGYLHLKSEVQDLSQIFELLPTDYYTKQMPGASGGQARRFPSTSGNSESNAQEQQLQLLL